jgi:CheY-like chemotaxis protein
MADTLYWSKKGEVACDEHTPAIGDPRRTDENWQPIPFDALRRIQYQCQYCAPGQRIRHQSSQIRGPLAPVVLNVDDRPASLYWRERSLRRHGFTVKNVDTGHSALATARQLQPQLILLDVHLPDLDGRDVCKRLKSDSTTASIPVILISTTLQERGEQLQDLRTYRADGYIPEPCEGEELAAMLWRVLRERGSAPTRQPR